MGLEERRASKEFQENVYPGLKKQIEEALGKEVDIQVDWESMEKERMSHLYEDSWTNIYFHTVIEAFKEVCKDDMGKEALQGALKGIVFNNESNIFGTRSITFEDGILKIDHFIGNTDAGRTEERVEHTIKLLSENL